MCVSTHKMAYQKETVMCISSHNSPILARMQLYPRKRTSLMVEQSFGVQIICTQCTVFELCVREKKEQNPIFHIRFSQL